MPPGARDRGAVLISRRSLLATAPAAALGVGGLVAASASSASAEPYPRRAVGTQTRWISGVTSTTPEAFGTWRRSPVAILGMFADESVAAQREVYQFVHGSLNCDVDLAVGGPIGSSWAQAAAGSQTALWREIAAVLRDNWHYRTVYLRYAHEANGTWMPWSVAPSEVAAFKTTFRMFATTMRKELAGRDVKIVFAPNFGTWRYTPSAMWPGRDVVDVVGMSMYEWTLYDTPAKWRKFAASSIGPVYWSKFARTVGRPMAFSEWGGRSPYFIRAMNAWMRANAGRAAGRLLYDVYLNANEFVLRGTTASAYRAVTWGR
jgi:hypothetical protein